MMDNTLASCVRFARSLLGALLRSFFPIVSASFPPACFLLIPQTQANESKKKRKQKKTKENKRKEKKRKERKGEQKEKRGIERRIYLGVELESVQSCMLRSLLLSEQNELLRTGTRCRHGLGLSCIARDIHPVLLSLFRTCCQAIVCTYMYLLRKRKTKAKQNRYSTLCRWAGFIPR